MDCFHLKGVLEKEKKGRYQFTNPVFKECLKEQLSTYKFVGYKNAGESLVGIKIRSTKHGIGNKF